MVIYRVLQDRNEYSHFKVISHHTKWVDAINIARELQAMADKYSWFCVDSVEVY